MQRNLHARQREGQKCDSTNFALVSNDEERREIERGRGRASQSVRNHRSFRPSNNCRLACHLQLHLTQGPNNKHKTFCTGPRLLLLPLMNKSLLLSRALQYKLTSGSIHRHIDQWLLGLFASLPGQVKQVNNLIRCSSLTSSAQSHPFLATQFTTLGVTIE